MDYDYQGIFTINDPGTMIAKQGGNTVGPWQPCKIEKGVYDGSSFLTQSVIVDFNTMPDLDWHSYAVGPGDYRITSSFHNQWTSIAPQEKVNDAHMRYFAAVPEPASMAALGIGLVGIFAKRRKAK